MRSRNILSIVAFVAAFGLSAAFASLFISPNPTVYNSVSYCKHRQNAAAADAIANLILEDYANGHARDGMTYDIGESYPPSVDSVAFADYAEFVGDYVDKSSSIETDNLPSDFQAAWREHLKAWRDYSDFLNQSAEISNRSVCSLRKFKDADKLHGQEIDRTYFEVLEIGASYGADFR